MLISRAFVISLKQGCPARGLPGCVTWPTDTFVNIVCMYVHIIIKSFYSLWSNGHPWGASRHCGLQLSPWPRSLIFLFPYLILYCPSPRSLRPTSLLYPWGFQSNALFSIAPVSLRNVCSIQFHFLLFIWFSIDFWWVILHSSSIVILAVHFIFIIRLKHLFTNVCSLLVLPLVVFQVSHPYNNTDFTF